MDDVHMNIYREYGYELFCCVNIDGIYHGNDLEFAYCIDGDIYSVCYYEI